MRNPKDTEKLEKLKKAYGAKVFGRLEIVAADLLDAESLDKAIEGQDVVVHVASPIPVVAPADENELIRPAVEGTLAVLRAAQKHKVKRVVITSSGLSIFVQKPENFKPTFTEDDFSDVSVMDGYAKSKLLAEKAAWDFWKALPETDRFDLVVIIPGLIQGPAIFPNDDYSAANIKRIMMGLMPALPDVRFPVVDVRDVVFAHVQGAKVPDAKNQRFILINDTYKIAEMSAILQKNYAGSSYKFTTDIATAPPPNNSLVQLIWGRDFRFDNSRSKSILGVKYRKIEDSLVAAAEAMIQGGLIPDLRAKQAPATAKADSTITLYWHIISQPSRSVKAILLAGAIPHKTESVDFLKGEQKEERFAKLNPRQLIPFITDSDSLVLSESNAILKYICSKHSSSVPAHYWPADPKQRALTDQFLEYYQQSFRPALISPLKVRMAKGVYGKAFDEEAWKTTLASLWTQLDVFETLLAKNPGRFVISDSPSIADLQLFFEFQNMVYMRLEWVEKYPKIDKWYKDMLTLPNVKAIYDEWLPVSVSVAKTLNDW